MDYTFKAPLKKEWRITDDKLYTGNNVYPLSAITFVLNMPSGSILTDGLMQINTNDKKVHRLCYARSQNAAAAEVFKFVKEKSEFKDAVKVGNQYVVDKEFKMLCLACNKQFFYTQKDVSDNLTKAKQAQLSAVSSGLNALAGSSIVASTESANANQLLSQIRDFSKCPYCNSTNIREMTDAEWQARQSTSQNTVSSADELRKFKELLDSGVITQEEFDAKKKQLLGL